MKVPWTRYIKFKETMNKLQKMQKYRSRSHSIDIVDLSTRMDSRGEVHRMI